MQKTRLLSLCFALVPLILGAFASRASGQPCAVDTDCADSLVCRPGSATCRQSGSFSADGGIALSNPECVPGPGVCTWVLAACLADSQCTQPGWSCLPMPGAMPATSICFPKGVDCAGGVACPAGWGCLDFANVLRGDMARMWAATGSTMFCWPDVLKGVPDGTTNVDSSRTGVIGVKGGGSDNPTTVLAPTYDAGSALIPDKGSDKGSGCTLLGHGGKPGPWIFLALVFAWRLVRRHDRRGMKRNRGQLG